MTDLIKVVGAGLVIATLAGCMADQDPMAEGAAAVSEARAEAVTAECALYKGTGITPEGC